MVSEAHVQVDSRLPLVVDVDGSLLKTDLLFESAVAFIKQNPLNLFYIFLWLMKGRSVLKEHLAHQGVLEVQSLPFREDLIRIIREQQKNGGVVILATASHEYFANKIADHITGINYVLATKDGVNLKGKNKLDAVLQTLGKGKAFSYVGDSWADIPIWKASRYSYLVNPSFHLLSTVKTFTSSFQVINDPEKSFSKIVLKAIRVHQWVKNLLIFLPVLAAHKFYATEALVNSVLAFVSFSFCASAIYVINDLVDLESDRRHKRKKLRPFASGDLSIHSGLWIATFFLISSFLVAHFVNTGFIETLLIYLTGTTTYSFLLKRLLLLDVICLTLLYTIRILAGGVATNIHVSNWLLAFSLFFFYGLALVKRFIEIKKADSTNNLHGRAYFGFDLTAVSSLGISGSLVSILIFAMYISHPDVTVLYQNSFRLWLVIPILLYWFSRIWLLTNRGEVDEDPILFAIKDKVSYVVFMLIVGLMWWAM